MSIPRLASTALRAAQFICAAVVLGLTSYLLHLNHKYNIGPVGRLCTPPLSPSSPLSSPFCYTHLPSLVYAVVIAAISVVASLIWLLPTVHHIANYIADLLFCAMWFAVFGLLQDSYENEMMCGNKWHWEDMGLKNGMCGQWNAAQAFSFIEAILWFASFVLGLLVWKGIKADRAVPANAAGPAAG
jgi:hypothetical protein